MKDENSGSRGMQITMGIILLIIGFLALVSAAFTTMLSIVFLGWLLLIGGVVGIFSGLFSGHLDSALLGFFGGALSAIIGFVLISNPAASAALVTLLIGVMLMVVGAYRGIASLFQRGVGWGWTLVWGVLTFALGLIIWQQWPVSGMWVIGFFIGIEFVLLGVRSLFGYPGEGSSVEKSAYA